jgi:hypothetical protein
MSAVEQPVSTSPGDAQDDLFAAAGCPPRMGSSSCCMSDKEPNGVPLDDP